MKKDDNFNKIAKIFEEDGYVLCHDVVYGNCFTKTFQTEFIISKVLVSYGLSKEQITVRVARKTKEGSSFFINLIQDKYYIELDSNSTLVIECLLDFINMMILSLKDKIDIIYSHSNIYHVTVIVYKTNSKTSIITKYDRCYEGLRFEITHSNYEVTAYTNNPITKVVTANDLISKDLNKLVNEVIDFCKI